jgi:hypothetical protein
MDDHFIENTFATVMCFGVIPTYDVTFGPHGLGPGAGGVLGDERMD